MNVFDLRDFTSEEINMILDQAIAFKKGSLQVDYQQKKTVSLLFFEPSTRTHYSFEKAAFNLGCNTQNFNPDSSSIKKGESLYDTVKLFEVLGVDALVIRHPQDNYYRELKGIKVPIVSGGDGKGNHPSQSLLDLMTIKEEFGYFKGLKVVIVGDIFHSRVAHTNFEVMQRLGMEVYTSGPKEFAQEGYNYVELDSVIEQMDIVMLLRVQYERHEGIKELPAKEYNRLYGLTVKRYQKMKKGAIIMHPAPFNRGVEIVDELVESKRSRIFKQMHNGVFVRMALLHMVLENEKNSY